MTRYISSNKSILSTLSQVNAKMRSFLTANLFDIKSEIIINTFIISVANFNYKKSYILNGRR